jgi:lysophospholipase L1-like esterase
MDDERADLQRTGRSGRVLLVCVSLLASIAFSELLLRFAWRNPYRGERPDVVMELRLHHADRSYPVDRRDVYPDSPVSFIRTDSRGYILPGRRFEDPEATIAFLGGSTTECSAVTEELRFPALVSTLLEEKGIRANTLNAGQSGNNTQDALNVLLNHVVFDRPDVAVLMEAANDIGVLAGSHSYQRTMSGGTSASRWFLQWLSSHLSLAGAARGWLRPMAVRTAPEDRANIPRESVHVPTLEYEHRLRAFVGLCRAFDIEPVLMTQPAVSMKTALTPYWVELKNQERFNNVIRAIAAEQDVTLIDLARHVGEQEGWDQPMRIFYDGIHVTDEGSRVLAAYIADRLRATVLRRFDASGG